MTAHPADGTTHQAAPAGWQAWMDRFADVTDDLSAMPATPCPNCGARTLRVTFVGPPGLGAATGYFWCDTCLHGVVVSRMGVPDGAEVIPTGLPQDEWPSTMPDYTLVWPQTED